MTREVYEIGSGGEIRLPVVTMSNGIKIRLFDPYDMRNASSVIHEVALIAKNFKEQGYETIVVPATKPIPIAWTVAFMNSMNLVVLKKEEKPYYKKFKEFTCKSITSDYVNTMYITEDDYSNLNGKKVIFFDDVLSTGATYEASKKFLKEQCNVNDLFALFVLKEGNSYKAKGNIKWLGEIPI